MHFMSSNTNTACYESVLNLYWIGHLFVLVHLHQLIKEVYSQLGCMFQNEQQHCVHLNVGIL